MVKLEFEKATKRKNKEIEGKSRDCRYIGDIGEKKE